MKNIFLKYVLIVIFILSGFFNMPDKVNAYSWQWDFRSWGRATDDYGVWHGNVCNSFNYATNGSPDTIYNVDTGGGGWATPYPHPENFIISETTHSYIDNVWRLTNGYVQNGFGWYTVDYDTGPGTAWNLIYFQSVGYTSCGNYGDRHDSRAQPLSLSYYGDFPTNIKIFSGSSVDTERLHFKEYAQRKNTNSGSWSDWFTEISYGVNVINCSAGQRTQGGACVSVTGTVTAGLATPSCTGSCSVNLSWTTNGIAGSNVYVDGILSKSSGTTSGSGSETKTDGTYNYCVRGTDGWGNETGNLQCASVVVPSTPTVATPGACGLANGYAYPYWSTNYGGLGQCSFGNVINPSSPAFPAQGGTATWNCQYGAGPASPQCSASRENPPPEPPPPPPVPPPTNVSATCPAPGEQVGVTWTAPEGYTHFYIVYMDEWGGVYTFGADYVDNTSYSFNSFVGSGYTALVYTLNDDYTQSSESANASVQCTNMTATLTPDVPTCEIAEGQDSCDINFSWDTTNPIAESEIISGYPSADTVVATGNTGSQALSVPYLSNPRTFYLRNNSVSLVSSEVYSSCISGTSWDSDQNLCVATPVASGSVNVSVTTSGGKVKSNDGGIDCGSTCSANYDAGATITLRAVPNSSYWKFTGWSGDCSGVGACTLNIDGNKNISASFGPRGLDYKEF